MGINLSQDISSNVGTDIWTHTPYTLNESVTVHFPEIRLKKGERYYDEVIKKFVDLSRLNNYEIIDALIKYIDDRKKPVDSKIDILELFGLRTNCFNVQVVDYLPYKFEADPYTIYITSKDNKQYIFNSNENEWEIIGESQQTTDDKIVEDIENKEIERMLQRLKTDIFNQIEQEYGYRLTFIEVVKELPSEMLADRETLYIVNYTKNDIKYIPYVLVRDNYTVITSFRKITRTPDICEYGELFDKFINKSNKYKSADVSISTSTVLNIDDCTVKIPKYIPATDGTTTVSFPTNSNISELEDRVKELEDKLSKETSLSIIDNIITW